jgi:hypothetical protein
MEQAAAIKRTVEILFHAPAWKRLKQFIETADHDADREVIVKQIRLQLIADLTQFRKKP